MTTSRVPLPSASGAVAENSGRLIWWPLLAACLATNTYVALSGSVSVWWATETTPKTSSLPSAIQQVLSARPQTSEADVHVVLWFLAGIAAMFAVRTWRSRAILLGGLVAYSGLLEIAQSLTPIRTAQWTDFAGNAVGILVAAAVVGLAGMLRARRNERMQVEAT